MGENLFAQFNEMFDIAGLKDDVNNASKNTGEFVKVPHGDYEVKVVKIELGVTGANSKNPNMPMGKVWFEVVAGDYKGQKIFMNQMLNNGFGIHKMNEFLTSLETGITIVFDDFEQYNELFNEVFAAVDGRAEFQLAYAQNNKGFDTYTIVQRY